MNSPSRCDVCDEPFSECYEKSLTKKRCYLYNGQPESNFAVTEPVATIPPAVTHRSCPVCGFLIAQREIENIVCDFKCPRCEQRTIREFQPVKLP